MASEKLPELTDESRMTFGKFKGVRLADVEPSYFWWAWEGENSPKVHANPAHPLHAYIVKNWARLCKLCPDYDPENHPPRATRTATQPPGGFTRPEIVLCIAVVGILATPVFLFVMFLLSGNTR